MRPEIPKEVVRGYGQSWIPFAEDYTTSIGYGELRSQYMKLFQQMEGAENEFSKEYKDMPYEVAKEQMKHFLLQHKLIPKDRFQFFIHEMELWKYVPKLAVIEIVKNPESINELDTELYKDKIILDTVIENKIPLRLTKGTPEQ